MKMYKLLPALLIFILAYGCGTNTHSNQSPVTTTDTTSAPVSTTGLAVETQKPNTEKKVISK